MLTRDRKVQDLAGWLDRRQGEEAVPKAQI
jgi:hypothetical protein